MNTEPLKLKNFHPKKPNFCGFFGFIRNFTNKFLTCYIPFHALLFHVVLYQTCQRVVNGAAMKDEKRQKNKPQLRFSYASAAFFLELVTGVEPATH